MSTHDQIVARLMKREGVREEVERLEQEMQALLKLLALGTAEFKQGKSSDAEAFLDQMDD